MPLTFMLSAARPRHSGGPVNINLSDVLTSTTGLSENANGEYFAPVNQWDSVGDGKEDGKEYTFKPDSLGRKVKKITANIRYDYVNPRQLSVLMFYRKVGNSYTRLLGVHDDWNVQNGFHVVDDTHQYSMARTWAINETLTRTLSTPIPLNELVMKAGGRSGYEYLPIYISNLVFEYE